MLIGSIFLSGPDVSLFAADLGDFQPAQDHIEPEMLDPTPRPQPVEQEELPPLAFTRLENASGRGKVCLKMSI